MSITFGTTYKSGLIEANPSATFAITVPAGAQMYVGVLSGFVWGTAKTVSGITANGIALTKLEGLSGYATRRFELWHLKTPDTGAQNLVVTLTGPTDVDHRVGVIVRFPIGADPTAPVRDSAIVDAPGIDYVGPAVTSAVGDTVVDFGYSRTDVASFVADAGQTDPQTVGDGSIVIFSSLKAGASPTVTTGWEDQADGSPGYDGVIAAVSLIPGAASAAELAGTATASATATGDLTTTPAVKGVSIQLGDGTPAANLTGLSVRWWDAEAPTGAPEYESDVETTDASGWLEIDLSAVTALAIGASGYLHVFKAGATPADDIVAAGRVPVSDIA